jgi:methyl-accepting chemotaxis protein
MEVIKMKSIFRFFRNLSTQKKIFLSGCIGITLFVITIFLYFIPKVEEDLIGEKRLKLKEIVDGGISILKTIDNEYRNGIITLEEAQSRAVKIFKNFRYGPEGKDYIWINDFHPKMIMHPWITELDGTDLSDYKDPVGKRLFVEFVDVCKKDGKGFVDYLWQWKDQKDKIVPKISYVEAFKPWGWIIGSGIYIEDVKEGIWSLQKNLIIVFLVIIFVMFTFFLIIARAISRPIIRIRDFANNLAKGDFTGTIELDQKDEVGILGKSLNEATSNIERMISNVIYSVNSLAQAVQQISSGNQNLSQRSSQQASSLEEIASTLEEATATIKQNAENSKEANKISDNASKLADEGNTVVTDAVRSINEMRDSSKKIGDIISVINEIAFQTNLLALNAAVEAARAGEQGRGFAVVAGEVRNLAQRSGTAAKEIGNLIKDSVEKVERGTELANKSGEALREIVESIRNVGKLISEIATASEEQKQGIDQINVAVAEMDNMTQQNAALVEETASASEEMANQAQELLTLVEQFKISDTLKKETYMIDHKDVHIEAINSIGKSRGLLGESVKGGDGDGRKVARVAKTAETKDVSQLLTSEGFEEF